jgi:hypothetical protein
MSPPGTSRTSGDVRPESAKWTKADTDPVLWDEDQRRVVRPGPRQPNASSSATAAAQAIAAARCPSPGGQVPFAGFAMASCASCDGTQNDPDDVQPCGHEPPGPAGFGTGNGSASVAVANSARMTVAMVAIKLLGSCLNAPESVLFFASLLGYRNRLNAACLLAISKTERHKKLSEVWNAGVV